MLILALTMGIVPLSACGRKDEGGTVTRGEWIQPAAIAAVLPTSSRVTALSGSSSPLGKIESTPHFDLTDLSPDVLQQDMDQVRISTGASGGVTQNATGELKASGTVV